MRRLYPWVTLHQLQTRRFGLHNLREKEVWLPAPVAYRVPTYTRSRWHPKPNVHYGIYQPGTRRQYPVVIEENASILSPEPLQELIRDEASAVFPSQLATPTSSPASLDAGQSPTAVINDTLKEDFPTFISCDLRHTSPEDVEYLRAKGCFTFPQKDVQDELLRWYFDYVHPQIPMLDEEEMWERYLQKTSRRMDVYPNDGAQKISLLLFRAMLFAASTFAPMGILRKAGFNTRRVARQSFFSKVRALYSLDVERDGMNLLQSLLLMSYWRDSPGDDDKDAWHWSGLAFARATQIGLHRQPMCDLSERQRALRKRCWWSCVVRDRLLALSESRTPRIRLEDSNVPLPTLADYNVGLRSSMSGLSPGEELCKRTTTTMFAIHLIRLVLCFDRQYRPQMPGDDLHHFSRAKAETWTRDRHHKPRSENPSRILDDLDQWKSNLPQVLRRPENCDTDGAVLPCIPVHRSTLHFYYQ